MVTTLSPLDELRVDCLGLERDRGLRQRSLTELGRYLHDFFDHCSRAGLTKPAEISPEVMHAFVVERTAGKGPALVKAVVWAMRKLGAFLALKGILDRDPAAALHHPRIQARAQLPRFLSSDELRALLETAARHRSARDLVVLSLMASTGMRPSDVVDLKSGDINLAEQRIDHRTKGGWRKAMPLSGPLIRILEPYLGSRDDAVPAAFINDQGRPLTVSWIQRLVRDCGAQAGIAGLTPNILRHTFATHAADRHGVVVTKALLGHSGLTRSEVYLHLSARRFRAVVRLHPYQCCHLLGVCDA